MQWGGFILPNLLTSLNLFCGFYSILASIEGEFIAAAVAILLSGGFDSLDGRIARATNTTSQFGLEYDSMSDLISFGLAPGLLAYLWALRSLGCLGWLTAFLFMTCGALRLARFNSKNKVNKKVSNYFIGLPITASACMIAATVLFSYKTGLLAYRISYLVLFLLYALSFLMVSTIRYISFKRDELFRNINFNSSIILIFLLTFIALQPSISLFIFGFCYTCSGPIFTTLVNKGTHLKKSDASDSFDQD